ncbi:TetR/AcrR family transcriptional regulator [Rhodococcus sp. HNM0569]|uniref:TetR family transcriptional regulator n=1 Tax=Rhodococcus sp. HNM0569 TaxID=2716340 RepID=UPI00146BA5EC|nr:TetR/AcrR family transcriptional regulator [Rhodococcus sp. HNM0569]
MTSELLPQIGATPPERGDAARNRALLLDAAAHLVAELGADAVTMDAVACRAGVGKGTVFRRFGSRAGLMRSLLDHSEREIQHGFIFGPPPLGPGAPPCERLLAYGRARFGQIGVEGEILRASERVADDRFGAPARAVALTHITALLRECGVDSDAALLAEALYAPLDASLVMHQTRERGIALERLEAAWCELVRRVVHSGCTAPADAHAH